MKLSTVPPPLIWMPVPAYAGPFPVPADEIGAMTTSIVRVGPMYEPPLRLKFIAIVFRRSASSLFMEARTAPEKLAWPVDRIRYHCLPEVSWLVDIPAVSTVTHARVDVAPSPVMDWVNDAAGR